MALDKTDGHTLPQGMVLGQEEDIVASLEMRNSVALPFLKSAFAVTNRRIVGYYRTGMFGTDQFQFPLTNVASVSVSTGVSFWMMMFGVLLALFGFGMLLAGEVLGMLIGGALGALLIVSSVKAIFAITNTAGERLFARATVFDRGRALEFVALASREIANVTQRVEIVDRSG